jgi:16S rRNA (cytidine1402-2'-O)-methyltransferase
MKPTLFLIPAPLTDGPPEMVLPAEINTVLQDLNYLIVENIKTAFRIIRRTGIKKNFDDFVFFTLDEHTSSGEMNDLLKPMHEGHNMGLMSEAGMPALADPGTELIAMVHKAGYRVKPLTGPSSITLAVIASGMNGQNFAFNGYLPVKKEARIMTIRKLEEKLYRENQTQIFMETPYRNMTLLEDLIDYCRPLTRLCIAADITGKDEYIFTKTIREWKNNLPDIHKIPAVFLIGTP